MKIRSGFVSNSSSSSFLITDSWDWKTGEDYTKESIFEDVKNMLLDYAKKELKKIERDKTLSDKGRESSKRYYETYYTEDGIKENVSVGTLKELKDDVEYWYAPCTLDFVKFIITDNSDNFIPEKIAKKIIKKYNVDNYNLHMG